MADISSLLSRYTSGAQRQDARAALKSGDLSYFSAGANRQLARQLYNQHFAPTPATPAAPAPAPTPVQPLIADLPTPAPAPTPQPTPQPQPAPAPLPQPTPTPAPTPPPTPVSAPPVSTPPASPTDPTSGLQYVVPDQGVNQTGPSSGLSAELEAFLRKWGLYTPGGYDFAQNGGMAEAIAEFRRLFGGTDLAMKGNQTASDAIIFNRIQSLLGHTDSIEPGTDSLPIIDPGTGQIIGYTTPGAGGTAPAGPWLAPDGQGLIDWSPYSGYNAAPPTSSTPPNGGQPTDPGSGPQPIDPIVIPGIDPPTEPVRGSTEPDDLAQSIHDRLLSTIQDGGHMSDIEEDFRIRQAEQQYGEYDRGNRALRESLASRGIAGGGTEGYASAMLREQLDTERMGALRDFHIENVKAAQQRVIDAIQVSTGRSLGMADIELRNLAENRMFAEFLAGNQLEMAKFIENVRLARQGNYQQLISQLVTLQGIFGQGAEGGS